MSLPGPFIPSPAAEFPNDNPLLHAGAVWVRLDITGPLRPVVRPRSGASGVPSAWSGSDQGGDAKAPAGGDLLADGPVEDAWPDEIIENIAAWLVSAEVSDPTPPAQENRLTVVRGKLPTRNERPASLEAKSSPGKRCDSSLRREASRRSRLTGHDGFATFLAALSKVALQHGATRAAAILPSLFSARILGTGLGKGLEDALLAAGIAESRAGQLVIAQRFSSIAGAWRNVLSGMSEDFAECGTTTLDDWAADLLVTLGVCKDRRIVKGELRRHGVAAFGLVAAA